MTMNKFIHEEVEYLRDCTANRIEDAIYLEEDNPAQAEADERAILTACEHLLNGGTIDGLPVDTRDAFAAEALHHLTRLEDTTAHQRRAINDFVHALGELDKFDRQSHECNKLSNPMYRAPKVIKRDGIEYEAIV
jgi:hypothetical protein